MDRTGWRRSIEVYARLRSARAQSAIDRALLDRLDVAAFVLDATGRLSRSNAAGTVLLDRSDGVERVGDRLGCATSTADGALRRAIAEARAGRRRAALGGADVVLAPRRGGRPLLMFVMGLPDGGVAVLARDPERQGPHVEELLQRLFQLTPSEARVAVRIAAGEGPAEVAAVLGVTVDTVRTHLKRVFDKTATTRQSQVVRLVMGRFRRWGEGGLQRARAARHRSTRSRTASGSVAMYSSGSTVSTPSGMASTASASLRSASRASGGSPASLTSGGNDSRNSLSIA